MARKKRKRKVTFRGLDGKFISPRTRRKVFVFADGQRITGASAQSARSAAIARIKRPPRKKPARKKPPPGRVAKPKRGKRPSRRLPSKKEYNSTFRNFLEPIGKRSDRSRAVVFALVRVTYMKYTEAPVRVLPVDMGSMTVGKARKITEADVVRRAQASLGRTRVEVLGIFALKGSGRRGADKVRRKIAKRKLR